MLAEPRVNQRSLVVRGRRFQTQKNHPGMLHTGVAALSGDFVDILLHKLRRNRFGKNESGFIRF